VVVREEAGLLGVRQTGGSGLRKASTSQLHDLMIVDEGHTSSQRQDESAWAYWGSRFFPSYARSVAEGTFEVLAAVRPSSGASTKCSSPSSSGSMSIRFRPGVEAKS